MSEVTFSVSERAFTAVFNKIYPSVQLPFDGSNTVAGIIWYGVDGAIHIEGAGEIRFEDGNTFLLKELKIGWDKLILRLGIDIPELTIGGFCLIRAPRGTPFIGGHCIVPFPKISLFTAKPDIGPLTLNLNAIVAYLITEISGRFSIGIRKDGDFQKIYADPQAVDVDPISISDTFGKLPTIVQAGVAAASAQMLALVPAAWMADVILSLLGAPTVTAYLLDLLDIHDDMEEWLMDVLHVSIGLDNLLYQVIFASMLERTELFKIEDPYPFVPAMKLDTADFGGFPVVPATPDFMMPEVAAAILNPSVQFEAGVMTVRFDFGG
ncbi:hypothetical protein [Inquilinus sp. Marseille-Q2685]|uniref:hypothetical protein n=1 Tax=Inquilinus sp. Marseille-Q2685 TaxID=2866581 RepID=UPI001CE40228|nr:hypothetical protein [Inquilinus sp. Marseille-Q2685]